MTYAHAIKTVAVLAALGPGACRRPAATPLNADSRQNQRPDSTHGVVLPESRIASLVKQCSRPRPDEVVGYWTPSWTEIVLLEARLSPVLERALGRAAPDFSKRVHVSDYYRQYGGLIHRDGRHTVYVNGFLQSHSDILERTRKELGDHPELRSKYPSELWNADWWREDPVVVCDGGEAYFGVEFDPAARGVWRHIV